LSRLALLNQLHERVILTVHPAMSGKPRLTLWLRSNDYLLLRRRFTGLTHGKFSYVIAALCSDRRRAFAVNVADVYRAAVKRSGARRREAGLRCEEIVRKRTPVCCRASPECSTAYNRLDTPTGSSSIRTGESSFGQLRHPR
jgi:hypothetical protein